MICLDASLVAKLLVDEDQSDLTRDLYGAAITSRTSVIAPPLLPIELTNIARKQMRGPTGLSLRDATVLLDDLLALSIELQNPAGLHSLALAIAHDLGLPATYDAHYLALSQLKDCEFWTDDRRLVRHVAPHLPFVRWIGEFQG